MNIRPYYHLKAPLIIIIVSQPPFFMDFPPFQVGSATMAGCVDKVGVYWSSLPVTWQMRNMLCVWGLENGFSTMDGFIKHHSGFGRPKMDWFSIISKRI